MTAYGLQLYTLRKPFAADPKGTLSRIREIGYDSVEFAAPLSMDFADLGAHLAAIGLDCPSVHAGIDDMRDRPDAVLAMARNLGCRWIVLPFVMPDQRDWDRVIADLNAFAHTASDAGFRVAYHHHDFEFAADPDGTRPFDRLVAGLDPALVSFELDVFWLKRGGEDPLAMISKMAGRVRLLHLKDYRADGGMDDVGSGTLDFPALLAAGAEAGVEHRFVEHDFPPEPYWPSVEASLGYLRGLG